MNAAMFIAYNGSKDDPVCGNEIVDYSNLNKRALEPVLQKLANAGIVVSIKGARGGYYMPRPEETSLKDVVKAFIECVVPEKHQFSGYDMLINKSLGKNYLLWLDGLADTSFKELCDDARDAGCIKQSEESVLYFSI